MLDFRRLLLDHGNRSWDDLDILSDLFDFGGESCQCQFLICGLAARGVHRQGRMEGDRLLILLNTASLHRRQIQIRRDHSTRELIKPFLELFLRVAFVLLEVIIFHRPLFDL